jgi:hypothetical protein
LVTPGQIITTGLPTDREPAGGEWVASGDGEIRRGESIVGRSMGVASGNAGPIALFHEQ